MTCLNATVTPGRAWLSADTRISQVVPGALREGGVTADAAEAHRSATEPGRPGPAAPVVGHMAKVVALPGARFATAGSGSFGGFWRWVHGLLVADPAPGLDEVADAAPARLAAILAGLPADERTMTVIMVGWSARAGRCVGYAYGSRDGFRPAEMLANHAFCPTPAWGGPDHPEMRRLSEAAAGGREVEAFHLALGRNQARACRAGVYGGGLGIGGGLLLAEVDEDGAECRAVGEL